MNRAERIAELERRIADLRARLPKHSVPPAMLEELEDLEEELERLRGGSEGAENETGRS
ncbi:MAG: histidine kinase [Anaerolineae bacterium]